MMLTQHRTTQGFTIGEVAARLRIRPAMLLALEQDDYSALPAPIYAIGFLRSYAGFLGLDSDQMVQAYRQEATLSGGGDYCLPPIEHPQQRPSRLFIWLSCLALTTLLGMGAWGLHHRHELGALVPPLPERLRQPQPDAQGRIFGDGTNNHLVLVAHGESWVEIRDTEGTLLLTRMLQPNDRYHVPDRPGLRLSTGDAGMIGVILDGVTRGTLGTNGQSLRDINLSADSLANMLPPITPPQELPVEETKKEAVPN